MAVISVFCGSRTGNHPIFVEESQQFSRGLVRRGHTIVYGGGSTGIMGVVADAALDLGGSVIGVIPECLATVELMHSEVRDMRVVADMHARKRLMHELSDAYAILPGGYGTMEEAFEAMTWSQLRIHRSPAGVLNCGGCYDALESLMNSMLCNEFLDKADLGLVHFCRKSDRLLDWLQQSLSQTSA